MLPLYPTENIIGRDEASAELTQLFEQGNSFVVIAGGKGLGKTTLAQKYLSDSLDSYHHFAWIDIQTSQSIPNAFCTNVQLLDALMLGINDWTLNPFQQDQIFQLMLITLRNLPQSGLLVLDDVTTEIEDTRLLTQLQLSENWDILATTSVEDLLGPASYVLKPLETEYAKQLFYSHYRFERDEQALNQLLKTITYSTRMIKRVAQRASAQRWTIGETLLFLQEEGFDFFNMNFKILQKVRMLIVQKELIRAFDLLFSESFPYFDTVLQDVKIMRQQFEHLQEKTQQALIAPQERKREYDRLVHGLLKLVQRLEFNTF